MCELKVYLNDEIIMEDVVGIFTEGDSVVLRDILGGTQSIVGRVVEINLSKQRAIIEDR